MKLLTVLLSVWVFQSATAQEVFDIISFTAPQGWTRTTKPGSIAFSIINKKARTWCQVVLYKSTSSKGSVEVDFASEWSSLVAPLNPSSPQQNALQDASGWKVLSGTATFPFNNATASATLTVYSGYNRCFSVLTNTNTKEFDQQVTSFYNSLFIDPSTLTQGQESSDGGHTKNTGMSNISGTISNVIEAVPAGYAFNSTTFDDGWTSTIKADWIEVAKGAMKVLLHYPRPMKNHVMFPLEISMAWDTLVSSRYSHLINYKTTYINSYNRSDLAMGTVTEVSTGQQKYVVLFRRTGLGWMEVVAPDKESFIQTFRFDPETIRWDSNENVTDALAGMIGRNKFAVAATDLYGTGEWAEHYASNSFWANYYTGAYEGVSTYSSSQWFVFGSGQRYTWKLIAANSFGGRTNGANASGAGTFTSPNNWQLHFTNIEGKPKTYDAYYTAVKSGRVLWLNDAAHPGSGVFTGYGKK